MSETSRRAHPVCETIGLELMPRNKSIPTRLKFGSLAALTILLATPAQSRPGVIKTEAYACITWNAAYWYTIQSLTPKSGQMDRNCPIRLPKGTKVEVIKEEDEDGYAVVKHRGKTWWIDGERLQ